MTRGEIARMIYNGLVSVNGKPIRKTSTRLKGGEEISVLFEYDTIEKQKVIQPNNLLLIPVLFENDDFIVIDKPAGIEAHPSHSNTTDTVVNWALAHYPEIREVGDDSNRPGIVHRLDKNTSGVMIIAKNKTAFTAFQHMFRDRMIRKTYTAFAFGIFESESGTIETPIARAKNFRRQTIADTRKQYKGTPRTAVTRYRVIQQHTNYAEVEVKPETGRMHQIRIHLASIGHPIIGDVLYAQKQFKKSKSASRQLLHATEIAFEYKGLPYKFTAPLPNIFSAYHH